MKNFIDFFLCEKINGFADRKRGKDAGENVTKYLVKIPLGRVFLRKSSELLVIYVNCITQKSDSMPA